MQFITSWGGGFLESVYENAMAIELAKAGLAFERQVPIDVRYDGHVVGEFRADLVVQGVVVVELKAVEAITGAFGVQLVNYLTATGIDVGLPINFSPTRVDVQRKVRVLPAASSRRSPSR